jgi:YYY domain-containing protein
VAVSLAGILFVGAYLRFTGLNWDEGQWIHPDEGHMRTIVSVIEMPDTLSLYFDTHKSPLNCRNQGHTYSYGTLPMFLTRMAAEFLDDGCRQSLESPVGPSGSAAALVVGATGLRCGPGTFAGVRSAQVGRTLSALADLGTVLLVYLIGRCLYGDAVGLLGAGLAALGALAIQQAHFFTVDSMACFFIVLTAYFSVRAGRSGSRGRVPWGSFALAGLATGLAAACKVSAGLASLFVVLGAAWWLISWTTSSQAENGRWTRTVALLVAGLLCAGFLSLVAFRVAQPYAFEGPGFLGVRPSPEWFGRLGQISAEQNGEIDLPSGRQWTDRAAILFPWLNMVVWGMGLPLGLAAWGAWALVGVELFRGKREHLVLWVWGTLVFLYLSTRWVKTMRYFLPVYPLLTILAAYMLVRWMRRASPWWRTTGRVAGVLVVAGTALWSAAVFGIYLRPHTRLAASRWVYANVPEGATLANEHWDWGIPLRVDGHNPFGGEYRGLELELYNEDTAGKRVQLLRWLDETDYVFLASNRLYASISRLPARYPLTTAYYRALFSGELGFELAADFTSYPALGPFQFPDQETPYPLMTAQYRQQSEPINVFLPPAEEAFSVYDHPRVLVFRKTGAYSRARVEEVLGGIDVSRALHGLEPRQVTRVPDSLMFDSRTWADQQAGGTWAEMFRRDGLLNRYPGLAAIAWWVVVGAAGLAAFPLLFVGVPQLHDRGYGLARCLGLLLLAYLTWVAASLRIMPNTRETIVRLALLLVLAGGGVGWARRKELWRFVRHRWRLLLLTEGLAAALFVLWIIVRLLNPDLWHPIVGGEKPMDFAYLNAVMKSTWFPPYNPWFSGSYINYYYFGFVIVGTLIKLMGTVPAIAYNLAVPLLFALTGVGAFSAAHNLFGRHRRGALLAGMMALVVTVLLGNLGVVRLVRAALIELGGDQFASTIPGFPETVALLRGAWQVLANGARLPLRPESWYWSPTRIIPTLPGEVGPISEFPAFTFLYADLHAHMIAFPITLLALECAICWARTRRAHWLGVLIGGLVIGALRPTNTWDYPTYLALGLAGLAIGMWTSLKKGECLKRAVLRLMWQALFLVALTVVLYLPYIRHYAAGYTSVRLWEGSTTPVDIYMWVHGILLLPIVTRLLIEVWRGLAGSTRRWRLALSGLALVLVLPVTAILAYLEYAVALAAMPVLAAVAVVFLLPSTPSSRRLLWLMVGSAAALSLAVEIVVLKGDVGRMNTVFKFYLQVWILLSVASGVSVAWVREQARRWPSRWRRLWWVAMAILILGGALFLPFGVRARATTRMSPGVGLTLDGTAFVEPGTVHDGTLEPDGREIALDGDYAAILWMQDNIQGSPVILEGLGRREYLWAGRVSIYTGLPAVVGWRWHQVQQRAVLPSSTVDWRRDDVRECYETRSIARAQAILDRYGVRYVYVGDYERAYYDPGGLAKFDEMAAQGLVHLVYDANRTKIFEVVRE